MFEVFGGDLFGNGEKAPAVSPKATDAHITSRDSFLTFLVQVLAEVGRAVHIPGNQVALVVVECHVLGVSRFGDIVPGFGKDVTQTGEIVGETDPDVKMRDTASLKLQNPEVADTWKA